MIRPIDCSNRVELVRMGDRIRIFGLFPAKAFEVDVPIDVVEKALLEDNVGEKGKKECWLRYKNAGITLSIYVVDSIVRPYKEASIWFETREPDEPGYEIEYLIAKATEMKDELRRVLRRKSI